MKRRAFTLAEILIAVGIIGVIAAVMLPMVNKYRPDVNKIKFLKAYSSICEMVPLIVNNRDAYPILNEGDDIVYSNYPLFNTQAPYKVNNTEFSGPNKFCNILATGFNTVGEIKCTDEYDTNIYPEFVKSFETQDGVQYMVQTISEKKDDKAVYQSNIFIDVDGEKGSNCFATQEDCKDPDIFKLMVSSDGVIKIGDPLAQHFVDTRTNWKLNRDMSVTGDMIADLNINDKEKILEIIPKDEPGENNGIDVSNHAFKCGTDNNVFVHGKYMNCWGFKYDSVGNIKMYINEPVPDNVYVLRSMFNDEGDVIGIQLGILPAGKRESVTGLENTIFKPGYSILDYDPTAKNAKSAFREFFSGRAFLSGENVCVLTMGLITDGYQYSSNPTQEWLDKYDVGGSYDFGAMWEKSIGGDLAYIEDPYEKEDSLLAVRWCLENENCSGGFTQEDRDKLKAMIK